MPHSAPSLCSCGRRRAAGVRCPCQQKRDAERNKRFDKTRPNSSQRGYNGAWEKARKAFLRRKPRCTRCDAVATVVDHITPHRGDQSLFWDQANWQPLCTPCHSGAKQREERRNTTRKFT